MRLDVSDDDIFINRNLYNLIMGHGYQTELLQLVMVRCAQPSLSLDDLAKRLRWNKYKTQKIIDIMHSLSDMRVDDKPVSWVEL